MNPHKLYFPLSALGILLSCTMLFSCSLSAVVPEKFRESRDTVKIYPDYKDIIIPPNIAPMNFIVEGNFKKAIVLVEGENGSLVTSSDNTLSIRFNEKKWHALLKSSTGRILTFSIFTYDGQSWTKHPEFKNTVAEEEIDPYISYRLIEPGYVAYHQLGIFQRDLQSFKQTVIYKNNIDNHCINCHTYQNRSAEHMMFHVRENHAGTIFVDGSNVEKVNTKAGPMFAACVYPSWHPTQNRIAYSTNMTGQFFFLKNTEKTEVVDNMSDLVMYDVDKKTVSPIIVDSTCLETFPSWAPSGDRLYYSVCQSLKDNELYLKGKDKTRAIANSYDSMYYDIWSIPYDTISCTFGIPEPVYEASLNNQSATLPRISPDGRWLLFTLGGFGQFHIWHKSSDLYLMDLSSREVRPLTVANSNDVDSFHTWSSNGRWIVFSTRREDGSYTRPYFCYFDKNGQEYKPFALPQENPLHSKLFLKSYNLPEFMTGPVKIPASQFRDIIYNTEPIPAKYEKNDDATHFSYD